MRTPEQKETHRIRMKIWRENNPGRDAEIARDYRKRHPDRSRESSKRWASKNPDRVREFSRKAASKYYHNDPQRSNRATVRSKRKLRYGVTEQDFESMKIRQGNKCTICFLEFIKTPNIDHNHTTGKVRDLLCGSCNLLLGHAQENIQILLSAIEYLKRHEDSNEEASQVFSHNN